MPLLLQLLRLSANFDILPGSFEAAGLAGAVGRDLQLEFSTLALAALETDAGVRQRL
jgi:hypothetical protein